MRPYRLTERGNTFIHLIHDIYVFIYFSGFHLETELGELANKTLIKLTNVDLKGFFSVSDFIGYLILGNFWSYDHLVYIIVI
jgi:hypothetical protein